MKHEPNGLEERETARDGEHRKPSQKRQDEDVEELTTKGLNYQEGEVLIPIKST